MAASWLVYIGRVAGWLCRAGGRLDSVWLCSVINHVDLSRCVSTLHSSLVAWGVKLISIHCRCEFASLRIEQHLAWLANNAWLIDELVIRLPFIVKYCVTNFLVYTHVLDVWGRCCRTPTRLGLIYNLSKDLTGSSWSLCLLDSFLEIKKRGLLIFVHLLKNLHARWGKIQVEGRIAFRRLLAIHLIQI